MHKFRSSAPFPLVVVVMYYSTFYKTVREGGTREESGTLTQDAPVFPGSSRLGIEPKTPGYFYTDNNHAEQDVFLYRQQSRRARLAQTFPHRVTPGSSISIRPKSCS